MLLVTVNLWNDRVPAEGLRRLLGRIDPDLLVAQEVGPKTAAVIEQRFAHGEVEGRLDFNGRALAAKAAIRVESLPLPHRPGYRGWLEIEGEEVEVIGVHIANPIDGLDRLAERRRQVAFLEELVARPGRLLLAGDLNSTPLWPAYRRLTRHLADGVAVWAEQQGRRPPRTWGHRPWWPAVLRIDHVLVRGLAVEQARVHRVPGGDHRALEAELSIAPGSRR